MKAAYKKISLSELPTDIRFEGYYWYADQQRPTIILNDIIQAHWFTDLPFVVEANFFSKEANVSIQVKYIDGLYHIALINLQEIDKRWVDINEYIGHDTEGRNFLMYEAWDVDQTQGNMPNLIPTWTAFGGFTNQK
jgi:CRISPR type III-associated protein (TIGR04423 family)